MQVEADSQEELNVLVAYLAQRVCFLDVEVEDRLLCTLSLVNRNAAMPIATARIDQNNHALSYSRC